MIGSAQRNISQISLCASPKLTKAEKGKKEVLPPAAAGDGVSAGGLYTAEDVASVVSVGAERGVAVRPIQSVF